MPMNAVEWRAHGARWAVVLSLAGTIPAFYAELLQADPPLLGVAAYLLAAAVMAWRIGRAVRHQPLLWRALRRQPLDLALFTGLVVAAMLPASSGSGAALVFRVAVALLTLLRLVLILQDTVTRGGLLYLLGAAGFVLLLCGVGFWWLEPRALTLADGLWLAFTTAATVGYGDIVPSTPASKIFSVFVVMLGYGVLSLVTAAVATRWIETEERIIEREVLRDVHRQMDALRVELVAIRGALTEIASKDNLCAVLPEPSRENLPPDSAP